MVLCRQLASHRLTQCQVGSYRHYQINKYNPLSNIDKANLALSYS